MRSALQTMKRDHVLTKTFFLLRDFPGRFNSGQLWVEATQSNDNEDEGKRRAIDELTILLRGTIDAHSPFWSFDGRSFGFMIGDAVMIRPVAGGEPQTIGMLPERSIRRGAAWSAGGTVLVSTENGVYAIAARGGKPRRIVRAKNGTRYFRPSFVGNTEQFLVTRSSGPGRPKMAVVAVSERGRSKDLIADATNGFYTDSDNVFFVKESRLFRQKFASTSLKPVGELQHTADRVGFEGDVYAYAVSRSGHVVFFAEEPVQSDLRIVDRGGKPLFVSSPHMNVADPAVSRDGRLLAYKLLGPDVTRIAIHDLEVGQDIPTPQFAGPGDKAAPIWSPDNRRFVMTIDRNLYRVSIAGGPAELLVRSSGHKFASDWSPDGRYILYSEETGAHSWNVHAISRKTAASFPSSRRPLPKRPLAFRSTAVGLRTAPWSQVKTRSTCSAFRRAETRYRSRPTEDSCLSGPTMAVSSTS